MPRRLLIALILCVGLGVLCSWLLPRVGLNLPWFVPLLAFGAIFAGVVLNTNWNEELRGDPDESPVRDDVSERDDDGPHKFR